MADPAVTLSAEHHDDVQGLVFAGWGKRFPFAAYLFVQLAEPGARAWLREVSPSVTRGLVRDERAVQIALTPTGLVALGVPGDVVAHFPQELKRGMHLRSRTLGDEGDNAPTNWTLLRPTSGVRPDALLMLFARTAAERAALVGAQRSLLARHGHTEIGHEESWEWRPAEPFGFADGLSQPWVKGAPPREQQPRAPDDEIATGEVLLGYTNEYGYQPVSPHWGLDDLGRNGSYLVFRKLEQHVTTFWTYFAEQARRLAGQPPVPRDPGLATEWLAARAIGRWRNGTSTLRFPDAPGDDTANERINAFHYLDEDPDGKRCPIASHVRRANPRDARGGPPRDAIKVSNRHRLLRRGRAYGVPLEVERAIAGDPGHGDRGLHFISLQASIARGFEFVQQTWLVNPGFHALDNEPDPISGPGGCPFTIPADPVRLRLPPAPRFVTVRGGEYFFLPSITALHRVARE